MSVVKKPQKTETQPVEEDEGWVEVRSQGIKLNPGDEIIFKLLGDFEETKLGGRVALVHIIKYVASDGTTIENQDANLFFQTIFYKKVNAVLQQYSKDSVIFRAKNLGKQKGKRYYDFQVKFKVEQQGEQVNE